MNTTINNSDDETTIRHMKTKTSEICGAAIQQSAKAITCIAEEDTVPEMYYALEKMLK